MKNPDTHRSAYRRIQKTGGSTYIVSLPKKWVEGRLSKGDAVRISEHGDTLTVSAQTQKPRETERIPVEEPHAQLRRVIAAYLNGANKFFVQAPKTRRHAIKELIKEKVAGLEAVEETEDGILFQNLLTHTEVSFHATLKRLHFLNQSMLETLAEAPTRKKTVDVESLEREADRFYILAFRQLHHTPQTDPRVHECGPYFVIVLKSLEKIADHAYLFSKHLTPAQHKSFQKPLLHALETYNQAMDALFKQDADLAEKTIQRAAQEKTGLDKNDFLTYNLQRILDYSTDIAEMTIDMAAARAI
ncbi:phosphate uptake regulator PhoU [Candidatus Micrarchaeota archaeon]|nr:phosphate uptake regulator PhoU [Candidatus Micrarchaeota archaeon]